jgi:hypothetical protein
MNSPAGTSVVPGDESNSGGRKSLCSLGGTPRSAGPPDIRQMLERLSSEALIRRSSLVHRPQEPYSPV